MTKFRGKFQYTIDAKGRINFPSKFRRCVSPLANETIVIIRGPRQSLFAYPLDIWETIEKKLEKLPSTPQNDSYKHLLMDTITDSVLDKQGRISISAEQIKLAGIDKEVLIVGNIEKVQLWNPSQYETIMKTATETTSFDNLYYDVMKNISFNENDGAN